MQAKQAVVFILAFTFCFTFSIATCLAEPPLTAKELIEKSKLKNHVKELEEGGIVLIEQPESEEADELDVAMAILVPAPLAKTVEILQRQAADKNGPGILVMAVSAAEDPAPAKEPECRSRSTRGTSQTQSSPGCATKRSARSR